MAHAATTAATATAPPAPAEWQTYDILVPFQNLPRTYSCDDLWYKFRDLLRQLGAPAYMTISPYHCGYVGGGPARSPSVEVKFRLPQVLHGAATRYAQISAVSSTVRLAPGTPNSLRAGDCELVKQLQSRLFPALPVHVSAATFNCAPSHDSFDLTLTATIAVPAPDLQASSAAEARSHP